MEKDAGMKKEEQTEAPVWGGKKKRKISADHEEEEKDVGHKQRSDDGEKEMKGRGDETKWWKYTEEYHQRMHWQARGGYQYMNAELTKQLTCNSLDVYQFSACRN